MSRALARLVTCGFVLLFSFCWQSHAKASPSKAGRWVLTWHDEFNGPNGAPPDKSKWFVQTGGNGWGNNELEYYTSRRQNVRQENGYLVIEAIKEHFAGADGIERQYTSARVDTRGQFTQEFGRFEARIKNPAGGGVWPAFWLLGDNFSTAGWPGCGEIDVMEGVASSGAEIRGSLHGPGYSGWNSITSGYRMPAGNFSDAFHVFAVEWEADALRFYVDGHLYATKTPADLPAGKPWVFNHPFSLILDLAVRGDTPGELDSTPFPQRMLVDYVRVYSRR